MSRQWQRSPHIKVWQYNSVLDDLIYLASKWFDPCKILPFSFKRLFYKCVIVSDHFIEGNNCLHYPKHVWAMALGPKVEEVPWQ